MNRRDLNRILMIGTALAGGWPAWLRRAFGAETGRECPVPRGQEGAQRWRRIVAAAYRRAQQAGKPLLAFVVPEVNVESGLGYEALWDRGRAFGELLNHGDDEALATLSLAEIVCAPMTALRSLVPSLGAGQPLMVLIETDGVPARVRALDVALPQFGDDGGGPLVLRRDDPAQPQDWHTLFEKRQQEEDAVVNARIGALSTLLHEGLRSTPQMLLERAAQSQARLDAAGGRLVEVPANAGAAQLHRMAAVLLASAVALPERQRQPVIRQVADAARFVLCRRRVPGSRWSNDGGCADRPELEPGEDDERLGIMCGMGHVPEKSRRFLDFLTRDANWRSRS